MKFSRVRSVVVAAGACIALACAAAVVIGPATGPAAADDALAWRPTLDEGCAAAKQSGRPVLVVTLWKQGVCNACDTFRSQVQSDARFLAAARRFELVEWQYDGLNGKVIPWTLENGGKSRDPSAQVFVVGPDGKTAARCPTEKAHVASQIAGWMNEQSAAWERDHPRTAMPFVRGDVTAAAAATAGGTGTTASTGDVACTAAAEAVAAGRTVVVYVARESVAERKDEKTTKEERARRAEAAQCREFERKVLDSKLAADAASGCLLLRLDLDDAAHAKWALSLGADRGPALLLLTPGEEKPVVLPKTITGADLAFRLKKLAPKPAPVPPKDAGAPSEPSSPGK